MIRGTRKRIVRSTNEYLTDGHNGLKTPYNLVASRARHASTEEGELDFNNDTKFNAQGT
jgi:hypothetical protein